MSPIQFKVHDSGRLFIAQGNLAQVNSFIFEKVNCALIIVANHLDL